LPGAKPSSDWYPVYRLRTPEFAGKIPFTDDVFPIVVFLFQLRFAFIAITEKLPILFRKECRRARVGVLHILWAMLSAALKL
jgi:hypothetical protein